MTEPAPDRTVRVELPHGTHEIRIGLGSLQRIGEALADLFGRGARRVAVITDTTVGPLHLATARGSLESAGFEVVDFSVPAGEASKSLAEVERLYDRFVQAGLERGSVVVALGGGVVGDLAGFAASTYLRGIPLVQAGTSVIAQVDSSIGGKVGVNLPQGKNLVGSFYQPRLVFSDVSTLLTLPDEEYRAGLAEVVKYGVIRDGDLFELLCRDHARVTSRDPETLLEIVTRSSRIKAEVVTADEKEGGLRRILNFGHTVGHALETAKGYGVLRHGEAVAIGMVAAARLAVRSNACDGEVSTRLEKLLDLLGLPRKAPFRAGTGELLAVMQRDKKVRDGRLVFVLPRTIGEVEMRDDVDLGTLEKVLPEVLA